MVITVSCPSCASSFPVDTNKIPESGVNARCSSCGEIFRVEKPIDIEALSPEAPAFEEAEPLPPLPEPELPAPSVPEPKPPAAAAAEEVDVLPPPVPGLPPLEAPETPEVAAEVQEEPAAGFRFGKRDPKDKAKRLARVLVSDMIMYNADRHASQPSKRGTLKEDFEDEIEKSWKEFVEQVGPGDRGWTPAREFWQEALNDILAKGEQLF